MCKHVVRIMMVLAFVVYIGAFNYGGCGDSGSGSGPSSGSSSTTSPNPTVPNAPSGLVVTAVSSSQINLSWVDNSNNEDGFKIYRSTDGQTFSLIITASAGVTSYYDINLVSDMIYYYRVKVYNTAGDAWSNEVNAATGTIPDAPSVLTAIAVSPYQINLAWTDNSINENGFKIERKTEVSGTYMEIITVNTNTTSYYDINRSDSTTYYYRVRAYNSIGNSSYSNEVSATTQPPLQGSLISTFGTNGVVTSAPSIYDENMARAIAIDSNAMYIAGTDSSPFGQYDNTQWRIEKRSLVDGLLITAFGTNGVVTSNPSDYYDFISAITIDSTAMYVVGSDRSAGYSNTQWRIEKRSLVDGSLITAFGTNGVVTSNPSSSGDEARAIAIDSIAIYVGGSDASIGSNGQWRIEKRSLVDGSLITAFGTNGVVTSNPSGYYDFINAITIDSTAMYVVGIDRPGQFDTQWRIEKRSLVDGSLITAFGTNGVVTSNPSIYDGDTANSIAIDSNAMYIIGYARPIGNYQWRIEKRSLVDGSLITAFGTNGVVTSNPTVPGAYAYGLAIDSTAMYAAGNDSSAGAGNLQWRIEKRSLVDGSLITAFGTNGVVTSNPSIYNDSAYVIAIDSTTMYVAGSSQNPYYSTGYDTQWRIEKRKK